MDSWNTWRVLGMSIVAFGIVFLLSSFAITGYSVAENLSNQTRAGWGSVFIIIGTLVLMKAYKKE